MAFPTTSILDNFNRANEGPPPSASWTNDPFAFGTDHGLLVQSNQCGGVVAADTNSAYWSAASFGPDCEGYVTLAAVPAATRTATIYARLAPIGSSADGYAVRVTTAAGASNDAFIIRRIDNASATQLGASMTQEVANGDSMGIECVGSTISAYYKAAAGSWSLLGSRTDSTYNQSGNIALLLGGDTSTFYDDLGGGTIASSSTTISPANATLTITGQAPTYSGSTYSISPANGALTITGQAPALNLSIVPGNAALTITGQAPTYSGSTYKISPANGALVIAGQAPSLLSSASVVRSPANASLLITGQVPIGDMGIVVPAAALSIQLVWVTEPSATGYEVGYGTTTGVYTTTVDVGAVTDYVLGPLGQGVYYVAVRSYDAVGVRGSWSAEVVFNADGLVLVGQTPTLNNAFIPTNADLVISGKAPTIFVSNPAAISPPNASLVIAGQAPTFAVTANVFRTPANGALVITGQAPALITPGFVAVPFASLLITGGTPAPLLSHVTFPTTASLVITGQVPTLLLVTPITRSPANATLTITGQAPDIQIGGLAGLTDVFCGRVTSWNPKHSGETKTYYFDASQLLESSVLTIDVTATVYSGTDPSPSSIISGSPVLQDGRIGVKLTGGVGGVLYQPKCTVTTYSGQVLSQSALLYVDR